MARIATSAELVWAEKSGISSKPENCESPDAEDLRFYLFLLVLAVTVRWHLRTCLSVACAKAQVISVDRVPSLDALWSV